MTKIESQLEVQTSIHPDTKIGHVSLTVSDLDSQITFYQKVMGFHLHQKEKNQAVLGTSERELLRLVQKRGAKRYRYVTGLYHFAVLFPDRRELARAMARLFALEIPNAPTDHILTKTTYLSDPEGNGIELYTESPEDGTWTLGDGGFGARRADGTLSDGREPLDVEALFGHLREDDRLDEPIPEDTRIGHVHLHVSDLGEALDFYHGVLEFDIMGAVESVGVGFVSAGGYHHHIGLNTWQGEGAPQPPKGALGLRYFSIELPNQTALDEVMNRIERAGVTVETKDGGMLVHDPCAHGVLLTTKA